MEVLIVSKTHMYSAACVGGLVLSSNRYVRLLNPGNSNQPIDTDFEVGDVWDIAFTNRSHTHPPHVEDVIITSKRRIRQNIDLAELIEERDLVDWTGHIDNLYDGLLSWTDSGSGYIPEDGDMPSQSVGFWMPNRDLTKVVFGQKIKYRFPNGRNFRSVTYVGYQNSIDTIEAGTILRVSLSRIFPHENSDIQQPRGYYLQLSGWY